MIPDIVFIRVSFLLSQQLAPTLFHPSLRCHLTWRNAAPATKQNLACHSRKTKIRLTLFFMKPYTAAFPGKYNRGSGVCGQIPAWIVQFGGKGFLIGSRTATETFLKPSQSQWDPEIIQIERFGGECCEPERVVHALQAIDLFRVQDDLFTVNLTMKTK